MYKLGLFCFLVLYISFVSARCSSSMTHEANYWTPERMSSAIPLDISLNGKPKPGEPLPLACSGVFRTHKNASYYSAYPVTAVGKVFFSMGTNNYVCSGSIADSRTVWTAGHCVFDATNGFVTNFVFIPAYHDRVEPFGRFAASSLCASDPWQDATNMAFDYAIARFVAPLPVEQTGVLTLAYNLDPTKVEYVSWGYPQGPPFDGMWENTCVSDLCGRDWWMSNPQPVGISCDSTGGCSGGPWIMGGKFFVGLNSYSYIWETNRMWGPYLDHATNTFYETHRIKG